MKATQNWDGWVLTLSQAECEALTGLLMDEAGNDGPLLDMLEALAPTWTQEVRP